MADVLTLEILDAAIAKMREPVTCHYVSLASIDMLALRLASESEAGVADGSLRQSDMTAWAKRKIADAFGEGQTVTLHHSASASAPR